MFWTELKDWYAKPFDADMDALGWAALVGLIIVAAVMWSFVLRHIREAL